ncbi:MAG: DUF4344 domain-containing metallopeptidase [Kofleriaceae bacterium]
MTAALAFTTMGTARAELVVIRGVELEMPAGWSRTDKGVATVLTPKAYKGRAIDVIELPAMPEATPEAFKALLGKQDTLALGKVSTIERNGLSLLAASGKLTGKKGDVSVDVVAVPVGKKAVLLIAFVGADQDPALRKANADVLLSVGVPGPRMSVAYEAGKTAGVVGPPKQFVDAISKMVAAIDTKLRLPRPLPITFKECGVVNAHYMPGKHVIEVCHELYDSQLAMLTAAKIDNPVEVARGTMLFVFLHEFGHALVGELALPITGRGEDVADELATLLLVNAGPVAQKAATHAARSFLEKNKATGGGSKHPYWDVHSFDLQRMTTIGCLLYGADKVQFAPLMKELNIPAQRLGSCLRDYPMRKKAWDTMLHPFLRKKT